MIEKIIAELESELRKESARKTRTFIGTAEWEIRQAKVNTWEHALKIVRDIAKEGQK